MLFRVVGPDGDAIGRTEGRDHASAFVERLDPQFALGCRDVDEKLPSAESNGPRGELAPLAARVHGGETIATEEKQPGAVVATLPRAAPLAPARVEIEPVADNQAAAAGRLHVSPVPR